MTKDDTSIRISRETKEKIDEKKGTRSMDIYLRCLVDGVMMPSDERVTADAIRESPGLLGGFDEFRDILKGMNAKLDKAINGKCVQPVKSSGGKKCKDTILLEFDQWANVYINRFSGKAQEYTVGHVQEFRKWVEGLSLEIDPMHGPGEG